MAKYVCVGLPVILGMLFFSAGCLAPASRRRNSRRMASPTGRQGGAARRGGAGLRGGAPAPAAASGPEAGHFSSPAAGAAPAAGGAGDFPGASGGLAPAQAWFAVQAKPNCVGIARRNLLRQGFATFAPTVQVTRRHRDAFRTSYVPLFPGYVFVSVGELGGRWRAINSTYGVSRIVSFGGTPAPLPGDFVAALMARCDAEGRVLPEPPADELAVGDGVRIRVGPFANLVGEIVKVSSDRRVVLLLDLLGGSARVAVSAGQLTKLP